MTVSIIIAVKNWQDNLEECIDFCRKLDHDDFEILVLPDIGPQNSVHTGDSRLKVIPTGPMDPARKRDIGHKQARGDVLAFLDDDAYPVKDWLNQALKNFADSDIAAVGGPAVTPLHDETMAKASGLVYASPLVAGQYIYRYVPGKRREVDDYPSCNFLVRKDTMAELGGFGTGFWPGEDTKLCLDITKKLGKKIIYDPQVLVYHHRRRLFSGHLRQIANYALHRGYFVKAFPETSRRPGYFVPTVFLMSVIAGGVVSLFFGALRPFYFVALAFYSTAIFLYSLTCGPRYILPVFFGIIATHFTYGFYFLKGLLSKDLKH